MKLWFGPCAVLLSIFLLGNASAELKPGDKITGVREWKFTDGTKKRARINISRKGEIWVGGDGRVPFKVEVDRSVPEQKEILQMVESQKVELVRPVIGFSITTPVGEVDVEDPFTFDRFMGFEREWHRNDGKVVKGALLNVADDEISLKIGNSAWKVPVVSLSEEDKSYLDRVIRDKERLVPWRVDLEYTGFGNGDFDEAPIWLPGERFFETSGPRISFEDAIRVASDHLAQKLDRKNWTVQSVTENTSTLLPAVAAKIPDLKEKPVGRGYQILFSIEKNISAAKLKLGLVSWNGWHSVYVLDDGTVMDFKIGK